ncbi:hypothetical protein ACGFZL_30205 [Streptomyces sp. NPDC048182]|uniref:TetR/AcrR family transcriptional regulator n=1 Tax=Streptomyces sp. NPDC048182 TaxID=3365507 RepID=UPI00371949E2
MSQTPPPPATARPDLAAQADALFAAAAQGPPAGLAARLVRMTLTAWENPAARPELLARIGAAGTEDGAARLRAHFTALYLERVGTLVPAPRLHLSAAAAQIVGLIMARYVLAIEPVASAPLDRVVDTFAPAIQHHLDAAPDPLDPKESA